MYATWSGYSGTVVGRSALLGRLTRLGDVASNHWLRLLFAGSLALLPLAFVALLAEAPWLFLTATALSAIADETLDRTPPSPGRLLNVMRDLATQTSIVRIGLIAAAFVVLINNWAAAVIIGAGVIGSLLCRVVCGLLPESATGEYAEAGSDGRASLAARYASGLTVTELVLLGALVVALAAGSHTWLLVIVALAWLPSVALLVMTSWRWISSVRRRDVSLAVLPTGRVSVYFAEPATHLYQLQQWFPVLADVHRDLGVQFVLRDRRSFDLLGGLTDLPRFYARTLDDLTEFYEAGDHAVVLYVNNGWRNFQSLAWPGALHVHINHGESDKTSLVTHQALAYDRVLVAGDAAIRRLAAGLLEVDMSSVVAVGRPQLDYVDVGDVASRQTRTTVVYAPTWEGENEANNFSSIDIAGPDIVRALLEIPDATVLYKPHPRTPQSADPRMREAHHAISRILETAATADPAAGHRIWFGDVLQLLARADVLVADVSSVAVDHLYLRPDAHLVLMDRGRDGAIRASETPVARAATVVRADRLGDLRETISRLLAADGQLAMRARVRREYFGDLDVGESTRRFQAVVRDLVAHRDHLKPRVMPASVSVESN